MAAVSMVSNISLHVTDDNDDSHQGESLEKKLLLIWLFVGLSVIGIVGNSYSIFLLSGKKQKKKKILSDTYRIYIIALAVADIGMLFFTGILRYSLVAWIYETDQQSWLYEIYLCRWHRFFMHTFHNAAVWLLVVMAMDRFVAVCFPFHYREIKHNAKKATKVTTIVFFLSCLFASPFLAVGPLYSKQEEHRNVPKVSEHFLKFFNFTTVLPLIGVMSSEHSEIIHYSTNNATAGSSMALQIRNENAGMVNITSSFQDDKHIQRILCGCTLTATIGEHYAFVVNIIFHVLLAFFIPYFILILLNLIIFRCLHRSRSETPLNGTRQKLHRRITIMMLAVCCTFIILWLPQALLLLTSSDAHSHKCNEDEIFSSLAALSGLANSALNFFLYCMTVKKFRNEAFLSIRRLCCFMSVKETLLDLPSTNSIRRCAPKRKNDVDTSNEGGTPRTNITFKSNSPSTNEPSYNNGTKLCDIPENTVLCRRDESINWS